MKKLFVIILTLAASLLAHATLEPYVFTGYLNENLPPNCPTNASPQLLAVTNLDVYFLSFTLDTGAVSGPFTNYWKHAVKNISFAVPATGLVYTAPFEDLEVIQNNASPNTIRWDIAGVDTDVNMTLLCVDSNRTALASASVPNPLNLTGFHAAGSAQILLFNVTSQNAPMFYGSLVPVPALNLAMQPGSNIVSWVTSDLTFTPTLQTNGSLSASGWQNITNTPKITGLTNTTTLPAGTNTTGFFRLRVL